MNEHRLVEKVENEFSDIYTHFKEFQQNSEYREYWRKCMQAISDEVLLSHIIFCNDYFHIPPVKTFLTYYKDDFIIITGNKNAVLDDFVKRSIGAFWAMVFKKALGYSGQLSVSVSMSEYYLIKTATYYYGGEKE